MSVLNWISNQGLLDDPSGTTVDGVESTVTTEQLSDGSFTAIRDWSQYVENPNGDFHANSALKIYSGNTDTNTPGSYFDAEKVTINFGDPTDVDSLTASNVAFRLNTINGDGDNPIDGIVIKAFDEFGNEIEVNAVVGSDVVLDDSGTDVTLNSTDAILYSGSPNGSALITIDGPVSSIEITYSMDEEIVPDPSDPFIPTFVTMTDVHFDPIGPEVDHDRFPSEPIDAYPDNDHDDVLGTPGDDSIATGDDADTISGFGGDDTLDGGIDDDTISGGDGNDSIIGGRGNDTVDGGSGDDTINAGTTEDHFYSDYGDTPGGGTSYDDPKFDPSGIEGWYTDPNQDDDRDFVESRGGDDVIYTGDDADTIYSGDDNDYVDGGIDDDYIDGGLGRDTLVGDHGSDTIRGDDGADLIYASSSTLLYPDAVDATDPFTDNDMDVVDGGTGDDTIYGGDDDDSLHGGTGVDHIYGEIDEDTISGGRHGDYLYGGQGDDLIFGYNHDDTLNGGEGNLSIPLSGDLDHLYGGDGDDTMFGGSQNDTLEGGEGSDAMFGGEDRDWFQDLTDGDYVDGGEAGDDWDTLDFRQLGSIDQGTSAVSDILIDNPDGSGGTIFIDFDASNSEDGEVTYFDAGGSQIGDNLVFTNIEKMSLFLVSPLELVSPPPKAKFWLRNWKLVIGSLPVITVFRKSVGSALVICTLMILHIRIICAQY